MFTIRPAQSGDYEAIAAIATAIEPAQPGNADQMRQRDQELNQQPGITVVRQVAVDATGAIAGYGVGSHTQESATGYWYLWAAVDPSRRGEGAGELLRLELERIARQAGAPGAHSRVVGGDEDSYAWAQRRGYGLDRQKTESVLDLTAWDGERFVDHPAQVEAGGLRLITMSAIPEEMLPELFDADMETSRDHPEYDGTDESFEVWLRRFRLSKKERVYAIAFDGERIAGYSDLLYPQEPGGEAYTQYTCVRRAYRGRGVALAVKLLTIQEAIRAGAARMRTNNNPENLPMLRVNERLGYQMLPGPRSLKKQF